MRSFLCAALALALIRPVSAVEPEVLGWSTHGRDMPYLRRVIARAPVFGVNMLQLAQFFPKHGGNLPESEQDASDLREICRLGKQKGVQVYLGVWEISNFPKERMVQGKVNLDDPATWDWMTSRYRKLFDAVPELSGVILTLREVDIPVQDPRKVMSKMNDSQRVAKLVETVYKVCQGRGKDLYVRDFSITPDEMKNIVEAMNRMPAGVGAMSKAVPQDWCASLPDNPTLGMYKGRKQIVEFDFGSEGNGRGSIPYTVAEEVHRRWANALKAGAVGTVARLGPVDACIFDNLDEVNAYAYEAIVRKGADPQSAVRAYCVRRFGADSAEVMTRCLLRTYDISNKSYYTLRFRFLFGGSTVSSLDYADSHIKRKGLAIWMPEEKRTEEELLKPTLQTVERAEAEKDEAIRLAKLNLEELDTVRSKLKPEDYDWVKGYFKRSLDFAELWKTMAGAYLMGRVCLTDRSEETLAQAKRRLAEFSRAIDAFEAVYGKDFSIGQIIRKRNFKPDYVVPESRAFLAEIEARVAGTEKAPRPPRKDKKAHRPPQASQDDRTG